MNRTLLVGIALTGLGFVGYVLGVAADVGMVDPYPGRAFTVTGVMVGITLLAVGFGTRADEHGGDRE